MSAENIRDLAAKAYQSRSGALGGGMPGPMGADDYAKLDEKSKFQLLEIYHKKMVTAADAALKASLEKALQNELDVYDLVMLVARVDDPFFSYPELEPVRAMMATEKKEIWAVVTSREGLASGMRRHGESDKRFEKFIGASGRICADPKPEHMWVVMIAGGAVSVGQIQVTEPPLIIEATLSTDTGPDPKP